MINSRIGIVGAPTTAVRLLAEHMDAELISTEDRRNELEVLTSAVELPKASPYAFGKEPRIKDTTRKIYALTQEKKNQAIKKVNLLRVRIKSKYLTDPEHTLKLINEYEKYITLLNIRPHPDIEVIKGEFSEKVV